MFHPPGAFCSTLLLSDAITGETAFRELWRRSRDMRDGELPSRVSVVAMCCAIAARPDWFREGRRGWSHRTRDTITKRHYFHQ